MNEREREKENEGEVHKLDKYIYTNVYLIYSFISKLQRKGLRNKIYPHLFCTTAFPELKTRHVLRYCGVEPQSEELQKHIRNADHSKFHLFRSNKMETLKIRQRFLNHVFDVHHQGHQLERKTEFTYHMTSGSI